MSLIVANTGLDKSYYMTISQFTLDTTIHFHRYAHNNAHLVNIKRVFLFQTTVQLIKIVILDTFAMFLKIFVK